MITLMLTLQLTPMNTAEAQEPSQWVAEVWSPAEHEGPVQTFLSSLKVWLSLRVDLSHSLIAAGVCMLGSIRDKPALLWHPPMEQQRQAPGSGLCTGRQAICDRGARQPQQAGTNPRRARWF